MTATPGISSTDLVNILFDNQPDSVMWFTPVFDPENKLVPVDFMASYCNAAGCFILNSTKDAIIGSTLKTTDLIDEEAKKNIFEQCLQVWTTNRTVEYTYYVKALNKYLNVHRSKVNGGVLNVTRDHSQLIRAKQNNEEQKEFLNKLVSNSPYGICVYEAIRNEKDEVIDFKPKLCNQKAADISAFSIEQLYKYTVKELMLIRGQVDFWDSLIKVVRTGEPYYTEYFASARNEWIGMSLIKFEDGYLLNYVNITHWKNVEKRAEQQTEILQGVLDASIAGIFALEPIKGFSGNVLDFKITIVNKASEKLLAITPEDKNKTFLALFPAAKANGLFEMQCQVLSTGVPITKTIQLKNDRFDGKYITSISKMGINGIVVSFNEIKD
jgi:PAS domain-containing protein